MISCTFEKIEKNTYQIKSKNGDMSLLMRFYGVEKPSVGDKILIHEKLLDIHSEVFSQPYVFKFDDNITCESIKQKNDTEYIVLKINNTLYSLKRIYG